MGATLHQAQVYVTLLDHEHWHPRWIAALDASGMADRDEWFATLLRAHLDTAMAAFVADHPGLLASEAMIV